MWHQKDFVPEVMSLAIKTYGGKAAEYEFYPSNQNNIWDILLTKCIQEYSSMSCYKINPIAQKFIRSKSKRKNIQSDLNILLRMRGMSLIISSN